MFKTKPTETNLGKFKNKTMYVQNQTQVWQKTKH